MYATTYHRASSVQDAVAMRSGVEEGKYLAGGMTLIATMKQRLPARATWSICATSPISRAFRSTENRCESVPPPLTMMCQHRRSWRLSVRGSQVSPTRSAIPHVRHMGTIGGSVANNDPAADYPAALLGLNATIVTNAREIKADDFFVGMFETALEEGEMITAIRFDAPQKAAYAKFRNPASRYAMTGVFVAQRDNGDVRVAVTGAGSNGVFRSTEIEAALARSWSPDALADISIDPSSLMADMHASAEYRANLVKVMAKRAVAAA